MNIIETNLSFKSLNYGNNPKQIFLHHAEASNCTIQDIQSWHRANGWSGCGYHFFVTKEGKIYRGRPENSIGAHCKGHNTNSLGICAEGNYMTDDMPAAQKNAIIELCKYLCDKYGITDVRGHKEAPYATDCPGTKYPLEEIKQAIKIKESKAKYTVNYCLEFQKWYNNVTKTRAPLVADGIYGPATEKALQTIHNIIRKF